MLKTASGRLLLLPLVVVACAFASCATRDTDHLVRISVPDQKMLVFHHGVEVARYDVSTSKFGVGDRPGSYATPLGKLEVASKYGGGQPSGMKFKGRRATGEIVKPNAPGRDPIVSRILWLRGREARNRHSFARAIYIHGTAEEWRIGTPASYGCIRMRSHDVIQLYNVLGTGASVEITDKPFPAQLVQQQDTQPAERGSLPAATPASAAATAPAAAAAPASPHAPHRG